MNQYTHLHVHTQFSLLDGAASINSLFQKAKDNDMKSLAITDHGNMYGVLNFVSDSCKYGIKPIVGCEIYVAHNTRFDRKGKDDRSGYHLILLAKDISGYKNLTKLVSLGHKEGFYYTPRIDKELLRKYSGGLMASSACLGGEIPYYIANEGIAQAEQKLEEYLDIFHDDFYLELQRHGLKEQVIVNKAIMEMAKKYNVKMIATNDVHFVNADDAEAHGVLIRLNTKREADEEKKMYYSGQEYLKTKEEMAELFADCPEAIANTQEIADKVENYSLNHKIVLPVFPIPGGFDTGDDYLRHLTYEGAKVKYKELTEEITLRIDRELGSIKQMGFAGYFLIVEDFIREARKMGVIVGPGRGSAAGSVVAFCISITNVDPIKYNLLFERFINPERVTMPDIDIDFDDENRQKVIDYVTAKYGADKVAQIITFGTMGPKMAIRDVARVLEFPLPEADKLAKLIPDGPDVTFKSSYKSVPELQNIKDNGNEAVKKVLKLAEVLEGCIRNSGTHACGVIIGPDDLMEYVPLSSAKDSNLLVTQYEGKCIESVGLLKMDFLGLKTLTILKDALEAIYKKNGIRIDLDTISLDDAKTYELFKKGDTIGIFQFESEGMRSHMKNLKPTDIEDLIAMNALYRPGPMENIPSYINRKHGREKIEYPHPILEEILRPTNGIMIYQEQIMQISQRMAGFSGAKADELRGAMGKKKMDKIEKMRSEFIDGALKNNIEVKKAEQIYALMEKFGSYGFNRSHSAAYSIIAYQTAYLKAHYPAEFMGAILTNNLNDIKKITFYLTEAKNQKITVLGPDINESELKFVVNKKGELRFGMAAIKNVGEGVSSEIIAEREKNGYFKDIFDLAQRVSIRSLNKKCLESLVLAGAFDSFAGTHRAQYFYKNENEEVNFIEKVVKNAGNYHNGKLMNQGSLFGEDTEDTSQKVEMPECEPWSIFDTLQKEKDIVGFYISGHPLDEFQVAIRAYCNFDIPRLKLPEELKKARNKEIRFAGVVTSATQKLTKKGDPYGSFTIEDYNDSTSIMLFSEDYLKYKHLLITGQLLYIKAKIGTRYNDETTLEPKILNMCLLSEVLEKFTTNISVMLPLVYVDDENIKKLNHFVSKNKGNCSLKFIITDETENISVEMHSKKFKVNINEFVKFISDTINLDFRLN